MKQQEVFKKIGVIINELSGQYEYLKEAESPLNDLELELFIANSHFLTDHVIILSKLNSQNNPAKKAAEKAPPADNKAATEKGPVKHEEKYFEPLVQSPPATTKNTAIPENIIDIHEDESPVPLIDLSTGASDDSYSFEREEPETIRHELILDEADWDDDEESGPEEDITSEVIETPAVEAEPAELKKEEAKPEAKTEPLKATEPEKSAVLTVNEKIMAQMGDKPGTVGGQVQGGAIEDLKQAITLNDKLLFIKELFNGYNLAYSEAIEILNRFTSFDEAELFLKKNYITKNNWEKKPETVAKFYALLKRRYA